MTDLTPSAIELSIRAWCKRTDFFVYKSEINEQIASSLAQNGIQIPFDQLEISIKERNAPNDEKD